MQNIEIPKIPKSKVREPRRPLRISVIRSDVTSAKKNDPVHCAVANAIRRCTHAHQAVVYKSHTYVQMEEDDNTSPPTRRKT